MSDISPEDRERLVKVKYGELWDDALETRLQNPQFVAKLRELINQTTDSGNAQQPPPSPRQQQQRTDKRNLLEIALGM